MMMPLSSKLRVVLLFTAACSSACGDETIDPAELPPPELPPERCEPVDVDAPRTFTACSRGSGSFGRWILDDAGLPAYEYMIDQARDDRALYFNTEAAPLRAHWAAFGNHRVNAMFDNDGLIELVTQDRGVEYANKIDDARGWFGGGFSYVNDGARSFATAYRYRPKGAETRRVFGMGYAEATTTSGSLSITHRAYAPWGEAPYLIDEVRIVNLGAERKHVAHTEVFDVARRSIEIDWLVSGDPVHTAPQTARDGRDALDADFDESIRYDAARKMLVVQRSRAPGAPPPAEPGAPAARNDYPPDPFLAALVGDVTETFTHKAAFLGGGDWSAPDAITSGGAGEGAGDGPRGEATNGQGEPRMLGLGSEIDLAPQETKVLRFAYGVVPMGEPVEIDPRLSDPSFDGLAEVQAGLRDRLLYFATNDEPALSRELAWHASQMEVSVGRRDYFEGPVVPQGSAYLYLHGADGAARDLGLFALPLVYTDPELARAELEVYMRIQIADGDHFSYAFQGNGQVDDAAGIHTAPSDLDLFFVFALSEYLGATGDLAFLDEKVPFWPKEARPDATVWDHVVASMRHLFDTVGTKEHGLIGVGTGDWSDGISFEAPDRALAIASGESVPNTQMAIAVLPRMADLIEARDPELAQELRDHVEAYRAALPSAWAGDFFGRAYFGDGVLVHADAIDLEAQVWSMIGESFASGADRDRTIDLVRRELDEPSPAGAMLRPEGQVWPAISGLLTEGYAVTRPDLAWAHFKRNTMFAHARAYPDVWYGIWSGPDGLDGPFGDRPGESWYSLVTPMTDFPTQNNNQHAMPLYAAIRMAGVRAKAGGLVIDPRVPRPELSFATKLVDVDVRPGSIAVRYAPAGDEEREVDVVVPEGRHVISAELDGEAIEVSASVKIVSFAIPAGRGASHRMVVKTESGAP